eukprot:5778381-Amphidinium_carterae.1
MSGRYTCVVAFIYNETEHLIALACDRLALPRRGSERLLHGRSELPARTEVKDWPAVATPGKITEYQMIV